MIEPIDVECLFAAVGLDPILRARPTLHKYQLERAAAIPQDARRRILRFLATSTFSEAADMPEFDYDETLALVSTGQTSQQTQALFAAVPDREMATDLGIMAHNVLVWAKAIFPRETVDTVNGPRPDTPDPHTVADFRRVWQVAGDPMTVVYDLEDGSLSEDQVAALAQLYPAVYAEMRQAVSDGLAVMIGRKGKDWEPSPTKSALIGILRQQDATDPVLTAAVQAIYSKQPEQPQPPRPSQAQSDPKTAMTPGEKAAAG